MDGFSSQAREDGDLVVVTVIGDVDLSSTDLLWDQLNAWLDPSVRVVVDCSQITFIDSMGLRTLVQAAHAASDMNTYFGLVAPSAAVVRVLELSGTSDLFTISDGVPEADVA
jgi:stage II sporulation protein AA (anti-sigma F factor antagonist)